MADIRINATSPHNNDVCTRLDNGD